MFEGLKSLGNLGEMMKKARELQDHLKQVQEQLARKQVTADAGGGMVQATVNGRLELIKLKIDKTRINPNDTEMLEDVIIAAVHAAQTRAMEMVKEEMARMAAEMGIPPGLLP